MSLLFIDGFDHYATADILKKWSDHSGATIAASSGRRGGGAMNISFYGYYATKTLPSSHQTLIVGFSINAPVINTGSQKLLTISDGGALHLMVTVETGGALKVWRDNSAYGNLLGTTAGSLLVAGITKYVEIKVKIDDSTGTVDIHFDGVSVLALTGVDTRSGGNATANSVSIYGLNSFSNCYFDDFYIANTAGSVNNDFLGDCRIDTIYPTSDGNYSQFTPSTGSSHYALVDETTPNTSDYNDGAAVNDRDSYGMGNLSAIPSQTIYGVQVNAALEKDDAGARSATTFVRSSSTNGDGAGVALSTSQVYVSQMFETNPNGSIAWTETTVNAIEAGVKVTA